MKESQLTIKAVSNRAPPESILTLSTTPCNRVLRVVSIKRTGAWEEEAPDFLPIRKLRLP